MASKFSVAFPGSFACVTATLSQGESCKGFSGAMISMSDTTDLSVACEGGCGGFMCRCMCPTGQAPLISIYKPKADADSCEVTLAPSVPGDVAILDNKHDFGDSWFIACGNYLASDTSIEIEIHMQRCIQCFCSGEGPFRLKSVGEGQVVITSFGSIMKYDVAEGEERVIDNGSIVAWTSNMDYTIGCASPNCCVAMCSGEGFITRFKGPGIVYLQTRQLEPLARALAPYINKKGGGKKKNPSG